MAAAPLSPTARAILGMLRLGPRTGYEIKQKIDVSTRFFWAASYGQIYPELKRLQAAGPGGGGGDPHRGRPPPPPPPAPPRGGGAAAPPGARRRTASRLPPAGEEALHAWLRSPEEPSYELRDEALLKL